MTIISLVLFFLLKLLLSHMKEGICMWNIGSRIRLFNNNNQIKSSNGGTGNNIWMHKCL